ncbi:DUF3168 domain-containing protein [Janthinobacterium fluminis]|uniref:DUF3168 domain-containing protein n=1 Tax=Janthinobacterium fluminis TaxID=2987524 RepID=A0ABT5JU56_9BURK|nr:DUF3168 domain-containing protein [Janthinobacterium fluminis]MDC8756260.1 DUF3168 domain-containing protein [Janthinobacterium fluminis]
MILEPQIVDALKTMVAGRVYPDVAAEGAAAPYITYQQVGGDAINFVEGTSPGTENARVQVNVWAPSRLVASALGRQIEDALRAASALQTTVLGARVATYDTETKLRGTRQDFSFWY